MPTTLYPVTGALRRHTAPMALRVSFAHQALGRQMTKLAAYLVQATTTLLLGYASLARVLWCQFLVLNAKTVACTVPQSRAQLQTQEQRVDAKTTTTTLAAVTKHGYTFAL